MNDFKNIIEEIEKNITTDIDIGKLANMMNLSVYEFRRIFTYFAKMPIGEYIRKRRLSLAAAEMCKSDKSITYFSQKYCYDSPSSFSRAFHQFHGLSPTEVINGNCEFKLLTKINVDIVISGIDDILYSVVECDPFCVSGICYKSDVTDTECCEDAWSSFYKTNYAKEIEKNGENIYAVYQSEKDFVNCYIGVLNGEYPDKIYLPKSRWVCFTLTGTNDEYVNKFYNNIFNSYIASMGYERDCSLPNIEVFPADMSKDEFEWEIRIPIK